ncbi:helix-turn-helix transcriptional regulator [Micromonospora globbae]|uniref:Helix-turn-helix transcriptional regulator n=1 Tax=Micromonospora globbae TaxID=1894969 RepID=A0ABZ1S9L4_9ACTN|nr:helix-turn-helix transcriptional regulator [Micromonospora globbae]
MQKRSELGQFLRARRAQVSPGDVDLPADGSRRVPGLRRAEVAALAGLSVDYYIRLEQGRERNPSVSVLKALGRALRLEPDARRYLFVLAGAAPRCPDRNGPKAVSPNLLAMLHEWTNHPVLLMDRCNTILAANQLGTALVAGHRHSDNLTRLTFLDPNAHSYLRDWEQVAAVCVAGLRAAASDDPNDPELTALVGELSVQSDDFRKRWAKAEVREKTSELILLHHALVGDLDLTYEILRPAANPDLMVKVFRAEPGSATAERLAVLGSLTAQEQVGPAQVSTRVARQP